MKKKYIVNRAFKSEGKLLQPGDEFIPPGKKFDHVLTDPEKKYIRIVEVEEEKPKKKKSVAKKKSLKHECDYCDRNFTTPQGKAAHMRFCKQKE